MIPHFWNNLFSKDKAVASATNDFVNCRLKAINLLRNLVRQTASNVAWDSSLFFGHRANAAIHSG
jgi:hypothetical protein